MKNNLLDKYFKDKLSNLDGGDPMNTWDSLSDKMDTQVPHDPIEDYAFDQKIKDAISSISIIEMPSWQAFVPSLDLEENLVELEADIALDDTVKNSLESLDAEYDASSWDLLANRLDAVDSTVLEAQDQELDQISYEKLLNYTVPQKAGDWEDFNKELDKEFVLPYKLLFKYKLAELAILASLILIFFQAQPHIKNHFEHKQISDTAKVVQNIESAPTQPTDVDEKQNTSLANIHKVDIESQASINTIATPTTETRPFESLTRRDDSTEIPYENNNTKQELSSIGSSPVSTNRGRKIANSSLSAANTSVTAIVQSTNEQIPPEAMPPQFVKQEENSNLPKYENLLSVMRLPTESPMSIPFDGDDVTACFACNTDNTILRWRLGAHVGGIYTYIMTPYDNILNINSYNHATLDYGAGLSTSLLYGNWELESGFNFTSRQYTPIATQNIGNVSQGFLTVEIDKIQMNLLSVPLNLRYHFKDKEGKTHFYMHGGATMHVATQANYFIKSNFRENNKRPGFTESKQLLEEADILADKIYSLGWFEGGSYIENRYLSVNLGLGFERKISGRYSIFGQTTYAQFLDNKGLGPNNDRFNSVEFSTGVRALFK